MIWLAAGAVVSLLRVEFEVSSSFNTSGEAASDSALCVGSLGVQFALT